MAGSLESSGHCLLSFHFSKASDPVSHVILTDKLMECGVGGQTVRRIKNWTSSWAHKVVISGRKSTLRLVNSIVPQGSTLGPGLFNIFINGLHDVAESLLMTRNCEE